MFGAGIFTGELRYLLLATLTYCTLLFIPCFLQVQSMRQFLPETRRALELRKRLVFCGTFPRKHTAYIIMKLYRRGTSTSMLCLPTVSRRRKLICFRRSYKNTWAMALYMMVSGIRLQVNTSKATSSLSMNPLNDRLMYIQWKFQHLLGLFRSLQGGL